MAAREKQAGMREKERSQVPVVSLMMPTRLRMWLREMQAGRHERKGEKTL